MHYELVEKYNVAVPRYTSYPPVPNWSGQQTKREWLDHIGLCLRNNEEGISLYIHLPYCEQLCTYCGCNKRITKNHAVEEPYIQKLMEEWENYVALSGKDFLKIKELHFGGGTPTFFSPQNLELLLQGIFSKGILTHDAALSFEAHPNSTTREHLLSLYAFGFRRISIGVQDLSPLIMKAINRFQTKAEIEQVTGWARSIGYTSVNYDLIYGLPFQTLDDINITMDFVREMMPDRIAFYGYAHVPWKSAGQRAFSDEDVPGGVEKYHLKQEGYDRLDKMGYKLIGMDHFALSTDSLFENFISGKMHRNFMGYTDQKTDVLLGLGASSISETPQMYAQNEKSIETYFQLMEESGTAANKFHRMTTAQVKTKNHILNLMCTYQTSFENNEEEQVHLSLKSDVLDDLRSDGLIKWEGKRLMIKEKGKDFIRNICAAIDPEFISSPSEKKYSTAT